MAKEFDVALRDSQGFQAAPVAPERFDLEAYAAYEEQLLECNRRFQQAESGLLVYRRVRANGVFYEQCRDYRESLALQLGGLKESMRYRTDIANFLEPWYGIGYIAACFGADYVWQEGQAPVVRPLFGSAGEILAAARRPIEETPIGRHILEMIEYFLDKTKGRLPVSFCDIQSPLNMLSYLMPVTGLFLEIYDSPDEVKAAAELTADLLIGFLKKQEALIGGCLARPGHGFASSRVFQGAGMSDDTSIMVGEDEYRALIQPADEKVGEAMGGTVYHSCGVWERKIGMVKGFRGLTMVDGAFSAQTDPSPNEPSPFGEAFAGTGVILNARAVGDAQEAFSVFRRMWRPDLRLIAVTYCDSPEEQARLYDLLHDMERGGLA